MRNTLAGKRIIIVLNSLELGGAERQAILFARSLIRNYNANAVVVGFSAPGRARELCEEYGVPWRIIPGSLRCPAKRRLKKLLTCAAVTDRIRQLRTIRNFSAAMRELKPDVIMPYTMHPNVICGLTWREAGAAACIWNQRDEGRERLDRTFEKKAVAQTPWFMSLSHFGADFLTGSLGVSQDKVKVIYNGVELAQPELCRDEWRKKLGISNDCFAACMIANLHGFKDHKTLIKAWAKTVAVLEKQAVLILAGRDDGMGNELKILADELGVSDNIRFLGAVRDIPGLLGACDLGVHSSPTEGLCSAVLEAMASGRPVVATDIPPIREAVGPDGYIYLAPPYNAEALADKIISFAQSAKLRNEIGEKNLKRTKEKFSIDRMCSETAEYVRYALEQSFRNR